MYLGDLVRRKQAFQLRQTTRCVGEETIHDGRMGHLSDGPLESVVKKYHGLRRSFPGTDIERQLLRIGEAPRPQDHRTHLSWDCRVGGMKFELFCLPAIEPDPSLVVLVII